MKSTLTLLALLFSLAVFAQSKVFQNVVEVELQSTIEITNNKQIVGYAFFYKIDKMKKTSLYRLSILDENLKEIGSNEFEGAKDLFLKKAAYESNKLLLNFYDISKKDGYEKFIKIFDLKGKELGNIPYDPEHKKTGMFGSTLAAQMDAYYEGTENIEGKGFVSLYQSKAKTGGADIQMIDLSGKIKWEQNITAEKGDRTDLYLLSTTPNAIILFQMDKSGIMNRDASIFLVGLSTETGKQLYKKSLDIKGISYEPMLIKSSTDGKLKIVSTMSNEADKFLTAKPIGFSIGELNDSTGEIKTIKDFNYLNDLGTVLSMKNESKSDEGYIKAHNICMMQDGSMVMIGEFFRKTVSAVGMAFKIITYGNTSAAQATIGDMFLLRIDKNLKAKSLDMVEKDKERVLLPTDGIPIGLASRVLTMQHRFGYMYTDESLDGKKKTVLAKGTFGEDKYGTVALTFDEKKGFTQKHFDFTKEKKVSYNISRGKPGYVMISKYNEKEKTMTINLEKNN